MTNFVKVKTIPKCDRNCVWEQGLCRGRSNLKKVKGKNGASHLHFPRGKVEDLLHVDSTLQISPKRQCQ